MRRHSHDGAKLFSEVSGYRVRGNGHQLVHGEFWLDVRNKCFTMRVAKHWKRLPRDTLGSPPLEVFKTGGDTALSRAA